MASSCQPRWKRSGDTRQVPAGATARRAWPWAVAGAGFVLAMLAAVLALRWRSHYSNVDDYLYALQTRAYRDAIGLHLRPLVHAWKAYGANSPLVPTLALPVAAIDASPNALVLVQVVPLGALFLSVRSLLSSLGSGPRAASVAAAVVSTLPPVLGYAAMYHFALAATACTALAAAAYARSDRLLRTRAALVLGVALGLLSLARVVAPIYIAALCAPVALDVAFEADRRAVRVRNAALAVLVAVALAAPWWASAGPAAVHYLTSAGYGGGSFTHGGSAIDVLARRFTWTATESGWLLAALIAVLTVWSCACAIRRCPGWRLAAVLIATAIVGLLLLGTSSNEGTAFALPLVVLLCVAAVWGVERMPRRLRPVVAGLCSAALVVPALALLDVVGPAQVAGRQLWQVGTPGLAQARAVLGCRCDPPDSDRLSARVLRVVGGRPFLLVRDDALLNVNSLRYEAARRGGPARLSVPGQGPGLSAGQLDRADYAVAGGTLGPYNPSVNFLAAALQLRAARFHPVLSLTLSRVNSVVVWAAPPR